LNRLTFQFKFVCVCVKVKGQYQAHVGVVTQKRGRADLDPWSITVFLVIIDSELIVVMLNIKILHE